MFTTFADTNPDEDPFVILGCGHVFTVSSLDGHLSMENFYRRAIDESGRTHWQSCIPLSGDMLKINPTCITCRAPIVDIKRYGRPLHKAVLDVMTKKHISRYSEQLKSAEASIERREAVVRASIGTQAFGQGYDDGEEVRSGSTWQERAKTAHSLFLTIFRECGVSKQD